MANIVYKITFLDRIEKNEPPFYYIGSKTNCTVINGVIFDRKGNQYKGSCRSKLFKESVKGNIKIDVIKECELDELLKSEYTEQFNNNVVESIEYFNNSYAVYTSSFTNPEFANYRIISTGKNVRLKRDDPLVISGKAVGTSNGIKFEYKERPNFKGDLNPFYGRTHSQETREKISKAVKAKGYKHSDEFKESVSQRFKGKKLAESTKANMKKAQQRYKGYVVLRNDADIVRVPKSEEERYKKLGYLNPYAWGIKNNTIVIKRKICEHCGKNTTLSAYKRFHGAKCNAKSK